MKRVILLHTQSDREPALRLVEALLATGHEVRFDAVSVEPGSDLTAAFEGLHREVDGLAAVLVCVSHQALSSAWFRERLLPILALPPRVRIVVRFDDVEHLPSFIAHLPIFDLFPGEDAFAAGVKHLVDAIASAPGTGPAHAPKAAPVRQNRDDDIIDILLDGSEEERSRLLEELQATAGSVDYQSLVHRIMRDLEEKAHPQRAFTLRNPTRAPGIRSWLLSALAAVMGSNPHAAKVLQQHTEASFEGDQWVRYWSLASLHGAQSPLAIEAAVKVLEHDDSGLVRTLAQAILAPRQESHLYALQRSLTEEPLPERRWHVLRALRIVALPAMVPAICELLSRTLEAPIPYDAVYALVRPEILREAAPTVANTLGLERTVEVVLLASAGSSRLHIERFARLLRALDQGAVLPLLEKESRHPVPERAGAAKKLLQHLGVAAEVLTDASLLASVISDVADGSKAENDKLGINAEVRTLCSVILSKNVHPPLSVGLFGDWGTGKSFFIERMRAEVKLLANLSSGKDSAYHGDVAQITFNAWHYIDTNLWASLVSHIFEQLALQVSPKESPEQAKARLLKELETARAMKEEAGAQKKRAEEQREEAEKTLAQLAARRAEKELKLADLRMADLPQLLAKDDQEQLKARLTGEMNALGIPAALGSAQELDAAVREAHSLAGRARSVLHFFQKDTWGLPLLIVALVAFPLAVWGINTVMKQPFITGLATTIGEFTVLVGGAATAFKKYLGEADTHLQRFEAARDRVTTLLAEKRAKQAPEELELEKSIAQLRGEEESARERLSQATERVQQLEQQLQEIEEGRSLAKFLTERVQGDDYRKHLGLISVIRRDFDHLEALLRESKELKTIDRIILYIDDLDRCPSDKVVDVLQAVHLLLAVPLFVVVVGVDSRWLLHSLEREFTAFQREEGKARREAWMTTPQAYLEKIFQLPFTLRRMQPGGYQQLMGTLLPRQAEDGGRPLPPMKQEGTVPAAPDAPPVEAKDAVAPQPAASPAQTEIPRVSAAATVDAGTEEPAETRDLKPRALEIRPWEGKLADALYAFIPTPRAAKRFANIYRVLKASVRTPAELSRFEGTAQAPGEFQAAMLLLAILTGFPRQAAAFFPHLLAQAPRSPWRDAFSALKAPSAAMGLDAGEAEALWTRLEPLLGQHIRLADSAVDPFRTWAPRVARFSFETARSVSGHVEDTRLHMA